MGAEERYEEMVKLREGGLTLREIGERFGGISRQRVDQIFKKFGRVESSLIPTERLARISKMTLDMVKDMEEFGLIKPAREVKFERAVWKYWENKPIDPGILKELIRLKEQKKIEKY